MKDKPVKKAELTAFAKECAKGAAWMLNGICIAGEITKTQLCRSLLNRNNDELLLEISKRYAKYAQDEFPFAVECGEVQDFQDLISRIVNICDEHDWFRGDVNRKE